MGGAVPGRQFPCAVGRGGIGAKRWEGDGITPAGAHRIEALLRRPDRMHNPCTTHARSICIAFRSGIVGPNDGWSDDPADPDYNRPVQRPHRFGHEALRRADPLYDLLAVLDWNRAPAVPGRGSAIFLHVWKAPRHPTAGCIAFRRADLAWILARWTPGAGWWCGAGACGRRSDAQRISTRSVRRVRQWPAAAPSMMPRSRRPRTKSWTATAVRRTPKTISETTSEVGLIRFATLSMLLKMR